MPGYTTDAICVNDLHRSFCSFEVLKGVSVTAQQGDVIAINDSGGSGKTTFLRCINFLEIPRSKQIIVNGEEIEIRSDGTPAIHRHIERIRTPPGMAFQAFNLWTHRKLSENVIEVPVNMLKVPRAQAIEHAYSGQYLFFQLTNCIFLSLPTGQSDKVVSGESQVREVLKVVLKSNYSI